MKISCNVIQDLMPLYIDKITSGDSNEAIEEHIKSCKECREILTGMKEKVTMENVLEKNISEKKIFKRIQKKTFFSIIITGVLAFIFAVAIMLAIQHVGALSDFYMPKQRWFFSVDASNPVEKGEMTFNSVFYRKEITNSAENNGCINITIRINGEIKYDNISLQPGETKKLDKLSLFKTYEMEITGPEGKYCINIR